MSSRGEENGYQPRNGCCPLGSLGALHSSLGVSSGCAKQGIPSVLSKMAPKVIIYSSAAEIAVMLPLL